MDKRLGELERIESAIESVYEKLADKPKQLVHLTYWTRHKKTWEGMAMELEVGRATLFRWRNEIIKAIGENLGWH
jgi:RinA family phage transcriptional activator